jgi:hypothetical protein
VGVVIRIPLYLAIAQWALLGALGVLVVVMFRQLGRLTASTAKSAELGPAVGSRAAGLSYVRLGSELAQELTPGDGQPLLIAFVDPTCPSCEELVSVLDAMRAAGELDMVRVLLLISDPPSYLQISATFTATALEIGRPASRKGLDAYRASATPLLVAVDAAGMVRAAGSVLKIAQVRAFVQSCLLPAPTETLPVVEGGQGLSQQGEGIRNEHAEARAKR